MNNNCVICNTEDWHSLDYLRNKQYWFDNNTIFNEQIGFKICKGCGFVTYTPRWTEEQLKTSYNGQRARVTYQMTCKGRKKNHFHRKMLNELGIFDKEGVNVLDIGCAFGMTREIFPKANVTGTEYSSALANYARTCYKVNIIDEVKELPDKSQDLVIMYHTLEHVTDARATLIEVKRVLKDDGHLYVAVPDYLDVLREVSGNPCIEFEELYHLNHHNVFSQQSVNNLFKAVGFETIKSDDKVYGYATLNKKREPSDDIVKGDVVQIEKTLQTQKKAMDVLSSVNKSMENGLPPVEEACETALAIYPKYLDPYLILSVQKSYYQDVNKVRELFKRALSVIGDNHRLKIHFAGIFKQWGEPKNGADRQLSNSVRQAEQIYLQASEVDPGNMEVWKVLFELAVQYYKDPQKANYCAERMLSINPAAIVDVVEHLGWLHCR